MSICHFNPWVDNSFEVVEIKKEDLDITLTKTKMDNSLVRNFVAFAAQELKQ